MTRENSVWAIEYRKRGSYTWRLYPAVCALSNRRAAMRFTLALAKIEGCDYAVTRYTQASPSSRVVLGKRIK